MTVYRDESWYRDTIPVHGRGGSLQVWLSSGDPDEQKIVNALGRDGRWGYSPDGVRCARLHWIRAGWAPGWAPDEWRTTRRAEYTAIRDAPLARPVPPGLVAQLFGLPCRPG